MLRSIWKFDHRKKGMWVYHKYLQKFCGSRMVSEEKMTYRVNCADVPYEYFSPCPL